MTKHKAASLLHPLCRAFFRSIYKPAAYASAHLCALLLLQLQVIQRVLDVPPMSQVTASGVHMPLRTGTALRAERKALF